VVFIIFCPDGFENKPTQNKYFMKKKNGEEFNVSVTVAYDVFDFY